MNPLHPLSPQTNVTLSLFVTVGVQQKPVLAPPPSSHTRGDVHVPQVPPQPSSPQAAGSIVEIHAGVQQEAQEPLLQTSPVWQASASFSTVQVAAGVLLTKTESPSQAFAQSNSRPLSQI